MTRIVRWLKDLTTERWLMIVTTEVVASNNGCNDKDG